VGVQDVGDEPRRRAGGRGHRQRLADYLSEKIWRAYGMERDAEWMIDDVGHEQGGCCLAMTLRDYGRFGQFILDGARVDGTPIVARTGWPTPRAARSRRARLRLRLSVVDARRRHVRGTRDLRADAAHRPREASRDRDQQRSRAADRPSGRPGTTGFIAAVKAALDAEKPRP
jgi:hypothetical protein